MKAKLYFYDHYQDSYLPSSVTIAIYSVSIDGDRQYIGYYRYSDERATHWDGYEGYVWLEKSRLWIKKLRGNYRGKEELPQDLFELLTWEGSSISRRFNIDGGGEWFGGLRENDIEEIYAWNF